MDPVSLPEHVCYVRCNYCSIVLAVGVPRKQLMETVTVKCGHCNNISFHSTRPPSTMPHLQLSHPEFQMGLGLPVSIRNSLSDSSCKGHPNPPTSSSPFLKTTLQDRETTPPRHHVVKPPERKHRVPSAYNQFMKEEIQRIKAAQPSIAHREAFSMAAKNWAKCDPRSPNGSASGNHKPLKTATSEHGIKSGLLIDGSTDATKHFNVRK